MDVAARSVAPLVVISHATTDKKIAADLCAAVEEAGIPCWIAPRDIVGGLNYGEAIISALDSCPVVLLLLSRAANKSRWVAYEIERAASKERTIIPLRLENVEPSPALELFVSSRQRIDAFPPPWNGHVPSLLVALRHAVAPVEAPGVAGGEILERSKLIIPVVEGLKDDRQPFRLLLLSVMVASAPAMVVGVVALSFGALALGLSLLLLGGCSLPPCAWLYLRQLRCGDYVRVLKAAVQMKDETVARLAIQRLRCFPATKELFNEG